MCFYCEFPLKSQSPVGSLPRKRPCLITWKLNWINFYIKDSLDNFIDIVVENSDSELLYNQKETKLGINFDTNEILNLKVKLKYLSNILSFSYYFLKIINKSSKEDVMHNNNKVSKERNFN